MSKEKNAYVQNMDDFAAAVKKLSENFGITTVGMFYAVTMPGEGVMTGGCLKGEHHEVLAAFTQFMANPMSPRLVQISGDIVTAYLTAEHLRKELGL